MKYIQKINDIWSDIGCICVGFCEEAVDWYFIRFGLQIPPQNQFLQISYKIRSPSVISYQIHKYHPCFFRPLSLLSPLSQPPHLRQTTLSNKFRQIPSRPLPRFCQSFKYQEEKQRCIVAQLSRQKSKIFIMNWYGWYVTRNMGRIVEHSPDPYMH